MLDSTLRPAKDRLLAPLVRAPLGRVHPLVISSVGLGLGLSAAVAASRNAVLLAVALWLTSRLADGLDGLVARERGEPSAIGGLVDLVFDVTVYAAIPIGLAFGIDDRTTWIATAVLLASFYLNAVSLGYVAVLLERRARGERGPTSVPLPRGLIEGSETIVLFTVALAVPDAATAVWWIMGAAVVVTAVERLVWAGRTLR